MGVSFTFYAVSLDKQHVTCREVHLFSRFNVTLVADTGLWCGGLKLVAKVLLS